LKIGTNDLLALTVLNMKKVMKAFFFHIKWSRLVDRLNTGLQVGSLKTIQKPNTNCVRKIIIGKQDHLVFVLSLYYYIPYNCVSHSVTYTPFFLLAFLFKTPKFIQWRDPSTVDLITRLVPVLLVSF
jgi:hypothetical protein